MKKLLIITIFFTNLFINYSFAAQIKEVVDGSELVFNISNKDLNRIKIINDKILNIKHAEDELIISSIDELGESYIRSARSDTELIAIYIITEKGHTYKLLLKPKSIPSTQIILKNSEISPTLNNNLDIAVDNSEKIDILNLLKLMAGSNLKIDKNYVLSSSTGIFFQSKEIEVKKFMLYQSDNLTGLVLKLKNKTSEEIRIAEKTFYREGVKAIMMETNKLNPKSEIIVYIVLKSI